MGWTFFETSIGRCGIAWSATGLRAVQLPEASAERALARLRRRSTEDSPATPPAFARAAIDLLTELLERGRADLQQLPLDDHDGPPLDRRIWRETRQIGPGQTLSYGELAARLDPPPIARAVGQAMARNPWPLVVPCHRVLAADGSMGGFSASGGPVLKRRLLEIERVVLPFTPDLFG